MTGLHAVRAGSDGPALVLLHGFPMDHRMWEPQLDALSAEARVLAPDLRGLGRSALGGPAEVTMATHADDVAAWMDECGWGPAVIAGLSMGGYVALEMWRRHRDRFAGLALVDTRAEADTDEGRQGRIAMRDAIARDGLAAVEGSLLEKLLGRTTRASRPAVVAAVRTMFRETDPAGAMAALDAMRTRADHSLGLADIDVPTTVVVGEEDELTGPPVAAAMAAAIPGARLVRIPEAGHVTSLEAPEAVVDALRELMERARRPGPARR